MRIPGGRDTGRPWFGSPCGAQQSTPRVTPPRADPGAAWGAAPRRLCVLRPRAPRESWGMPRPCHAGTERSRVHRGGFPRGHTQGRRQQRPQTAPQGTPTAPATRGSSSLSGRRAGGCESHTRSCFVAGTSRGSPLLHGTPRLCRGGRPECGWTHLGCGHGVHCQHSQHQPCPGGHGEEMQAPRTSPHGWGAA